MWRWSRMASASWGECTMFLCWLLRQVGIACLSDALLLHSLPFRRHTRGLCMRSEGVAGPRYLATHETGEGLLSHLSVCNNQIHNG